MALTLIPTTGQTLNTTRDPIRLNFATLNTDFEVNHVEWGTADGGKHKKADLTNQTVAPTAGATTDVVIYNKLFDSVQHLHAQSATLLAYPITGGKRAASGYAYIGGGNLMEWGTSSGSGDKVITPATAGFSQIDHVQITSWTGDGATPTSLARLKTITVTNFTVRCTDLSGTAATAQFYWQAIGRP